ncbi:MAG: Serine/threonine-protein kinase PknD [Phycisphaerae bacterium]|nr:Serine/threonine-protein kinase PknD [Phycisphaerae bacterium]
MNWLSDEALSHLSRIVGLPDLGNARYQLGRPIGEGGMGVVFEAHDRELDRSVAVKIVREAIGPDGAERLLREARIIARLEHPGIVPVHDVGRLDDGRIYYVMKRVRGQRLDQRRAEMTLGERLAAFERVCETVAFAHAHGVIHRDLKPQNIMLGEFGEVLVLDWGVARILRDVRGASVDVTANAVTDATAAASAAEAETLPAVRTRAGAVIGTPAFMAPEQARGQIERVNERSDVYALGAILHFLLTGQPPATRGGGAPGEASVAAPRSARVRTPRALQAICDRSMQVEPAERYPDASSLAEDVRRFARGQRVSAHAETPAERVARLAWNFRTPIVLVAAYLAMRALLAFWAKA